MSDRPSYDLAVAYRICPFLSRTPPPVCGDSKLSLATLCVRSFKESLGSVRSKVWVILDSCPPEYEELFTSLWPKEDLVLVRGTKLGNSGSFRKQVEILLEQQDAEAVYFAEDDYVYLPGRFHFMVDLLKNHPEVDFVSPYDHPDYYAHPFHRHAMRVTAEGGQAWKTQNGTTCSFLTRRVVLKETNSVLLSYARGNTDAGLWLSLTKHHVCNPYDWLTQPFKSRFRTYSFACAWYFNWRQLLFGRPYTLWVPVPSLATHMVAGYEAPFVDWQTEFNRQSRAVSPGLHK